MSLVIYYYVGILLITLFIHFIIHVIGQFDKKKTQEKIMVENAALILERLDKLKQTGGYRMNGDINKLVIKMGKYLSEKIESAKDEILEEMELKFEELAAGEEPEESEEIVTSFEDEFEEETTEAEEPEEKKIENRDRSKEEIFDITKRQEITKTEEPKKRKKGLFGGKK